MSAMALITNFRCVVATSLLAAALAMLCWRRANKNSQSVAADDADAGADYFGPRPKDEIIVLEPQLDLLLIGVQREFRAQAHRMPILSRHLLLEGVEPSSVPPAELFEDLHLTADVKVAAQRGLGSPGAVMRRLGVLPPAACARLRAAVDAERQQKSDTVDGAPDEQLNLSADRLDELIDDASASAALWKLPAEFAASAASRAIDDEQLCELRGGLSSARGEAEIFVRRYASDSRPWNPFHTDSSALTINLALADDGAFVGGELLACYDGQVRRLERSEGEATVHASSLLHGVKLLSSGVRYSLIIFVGRPANAAPPGHFFEPRAEVAALAAIMADAQFLARCDGVLGTPAVASMRQAYGRLQARGEALAPTLKAVVLRYGAPHLQPTSILANAWTNDAVCWSLRTLLRYAEEI